MAYSSEGLMRKEWMVGPWKTGEARWERRQGMRRRLLATVVSFGEGMGSSRLLCAWGIQA